MQHNPTILLLVRRLPYTCNTALDTNVNLADIVRRVKTCSPRTRSLHTQPSIRSVRCAVFRASTSLDQIRKATVRDAQTHTATVRDARTHTATVRDAQTRMDTVRILLNTVRNAQSRL